MSIYLQMYLILKFIYFIISLKKYINIYLKNSIYVNLTCNLKKKIKLI